jgi:hypothetical protein
MHHSLYILEVINFMAYQDWIWKGLFILIPRFIISHHTSVSIINHTRHAVTTQQDISPHWTIKRIRALLKPQFSSGGYMMFEIPTAPGSIKSRLCFGHRLIVEGFQALVRWYCKRHDK